MIALRELLEREPIRYGALLFVAVVGILVTSGVTLPIWAVTAGALLTAELGRRS